MKITLDIPDGIIAGFFNGVEVTAHGMQLVSYQLSTDDLKDGKAVRCPHCGEVINTVDIASTDSGGRLWYDFLERLGYYVPYEKRTKENDWYGKDMVLDNEQAKQLVDYAVKKEVYNWDGVESVVTEALAHGNRVVINADW